MSDMPASVSELSASSTGEKRLRPMSGAIMAVKKLDRQKHTPPTETLAYLMLA